MAWAWAAPVLPAARAGGRPRTTKRMLPREFPPWGTVYVYHYFQGWQRSGLWVHLHRALYEQARRVAGRAACPLVVIMDGQSVRTTERGGTRGFDAHKCVKGRKRHILVDTLGLLVANRVEPHPIGGPPGLLLPPARAGQRRLPAERRSVKD
jgi:putative transposase